MEERSPQKLIVGRVPPRARTTPVIQVNGVTSAAVMYTLAPDANSVFNSCEADSMSLFAYRRCFGLIVLLTVLQAASPVRAAETVAACTEMLHAGRYEDCLKATTEAIANRSYGEEWPILKAESELALGKILASSV